MNLGENIYKLRTDHNMSQGDLADALSVSRQSVSKWENNSAVPELEKLIKMSLLFGISLDALVNNEIPSSPSSPPEITVQNDTPHRTIGIVLLSFGLLVMLLLSIWGGFILGVMLGLPFTIVGSVLTISTEGTLFKSAWALFAIYAPLLFYFMLNVTGFGHIIRIGVIVIWLTILIGIALLLHYKGNLSADSRKLIHISIILALVLFLTFGIVNSILMHRSGLHTATEELGEMPFYQEEP